MSKYMDDLEKRIREAPPLTSEKALEKLKRMRRKLDLDEALTEIREVESSRRTDGPEGGGG